MIRSALVCTDGSPYARTAVTYARDWAERLGLRLKVLFVEDLRLTQGPLVTGYYGPVGMAPSPAYPAYYDDLVRSVEEQGRRALDEARQVLAGLKVPAEYASREGVVHETIIEESKSVELICLGRRGEHGEWDKGELGSTVHKVARRSQRPVLVTPPQFQPLGKMLVAYDGSEPAGRALRLACDLAETAKLPMAVITVATATEARPKQEAVLAEARKLVAAHEEIKCDFELASGEKTEALILDYAARCGARLIVMGVHGHSRIREWLLGGTANGVLIHSSLPVLLLR